MVTTYKDLEGNTHTITTVSRMIGTFVIFDNKISEQQSIENHSEKDYHDCIRWLIKKNGGQLL